MWGIDGHQPRKKDADVLTPHFVLNVRNTRRPAHLAVDGDDDGDDDVSPPPCAWMVDNEDDPDPEEDDIFAYNVITSVHPEELTPIEEQLEQDIVLAFHAAGCDSGDETQADVVPL